MTTTTISIEDAAKQLRVPPEALTRALAIERMRAAADLPQRLDRFAIAGIAADPERLRRARKVVMEQGLIGCHLDVGGGGAVRLGGAGA